MSNRIETLREVFASAGSRVKANPTRENLMAFDEAARQLEEAQTIQGDTDGSFKTQDAAILYLNSKNWKIGKSKFSDDFTAGLITRRNGLFESGDLLRYAEINLHRLDNSDQAEERLSEKELLVKAQRRKIEMANETAAGMLTPTEDVERMLAGRAARLKADIDQFWRDKAKAIVRLVGGEEGKIPDLIEFGQEQTEEHFSQYAEEYDANS